MRVSLAHATIVGEAFGSPVIAAMHGPAQKSFLSTVLNPASQIYFARYRGIVSEVYYPVLDMTETADLQFLIDDAVGTFVDEEMLESNSAAQIDPHTMNWQVATGNAAHDWQIGKTVFTDPIRNPLIERVSLQVGAQRWRNLARLPPATAVALARSARRLSKGQCGNTGRRSARHGCSYHPSGCTGGNYVGNESWARRHDGHGRYANDGRGCRGAECSGDAGPAKVLAGECLCLIPRRP
ncbi:hypothetical protein [Paraburkholderia sp. PGU19]|uniref:hypothetical protein n=1 Tax=Paraburkholderia sp. PGU19 TaxID=2735434 RepID=UPI00237C106D|nr:hypothetical protein [Paraburkholderia sp. PGU19]